MTSLVYSTGTVSVSNASAIVTGTGTLWDTALVTGGMFSFAGMSVPIASVESDTSLTLAYPWPGTTASGAYAIARETSEAVRAAWINDRLAQILTKLALVGIHPDGAGTLAERNALSPVPAAGYLWLRVEVGFDLGFYKKTASGWDGPFGVKGDVGGQGPVGPIGPAGADGDITWESAWVTATAYTVNQAVSRNGSSYVCTANHTSGAANEPGVGASWATVWDLMAAKGDPGAGVSDGDKGDISVSSGVWSIDNNVVTYAKMQDVSATARVLGRKTAGAGDPEELTLSDVLNMVGSAAEGDILFRSASGWTRLPKGTAGQYLKQNTALTAPEWVTVTEREVLTANRTYFYRTDGSNGNNGLANTAGGAFLTIQKAIDAAAALDLNGFTVTIQAGNSGTFTGAIAVTKPFVSGTVELIGDTTTPSNVLISVSNTALQVSNGAELTVRGFKMATSAGTAALRATNGGRIRVTGAMEYGVCAGAAMEAENFGVIEITANYTISGSAPRHWWCEAQGLILCIGRTITITGSPAFSTAFAVAFGGFINVPINTFSGSATGKRYDASKNGTIQTNGAATTYLPGDAAGTGTNPGTSPFGLYT